MKLRNAFTLIELLVVIAILAILAALLFPVFAQARAKARQATCASSFKQQATSIFLYQQDFDELMPLVYSTDASVTNSSPPATIMHQSLTAYLKNTQVYACPSDPASEEQRLTVDTPPPTTTQQREFNLGLKDNFGINWQYLSPAIWNDATGYSSRPTPFAKIGSSAQTILAADSVWGRDDSGDPYGGGVGAVDMPCWYYSDGTDSPPYADQYRYWQGGWNPGQPKASSVYGHVWPWHGDFVTVAFCDGHVKALTINALTAGCDLQDDSNGYITDREKYLWDLQ